MSLARAGGCVAEASIVHPCTRAPMYVGRINTTYRVAVGSCNTMHVLCIVTCTFIVKCSEAYMYRPGSSSYIKGCDCMHFLNASLMTQLRHRHLHARSVMLLKWHDQWFVQTDQRSIGM